MIQNNQFIKVKKELRKKETKKSKAEKSPLFQAVKYRFYNNVTLNHNVSEVENTIKEEANVTREFSYAEKMMQEVQRNKSFN